MLKNSLKKIYRLIDHGGVKILSFDIFDTLLVRPCIEPKHLFRLVGARQGVFAFKDLRVNAEHSAREKWVTHSGEVTLQNIYDELAKKTELIDVERLQQEEINTELHYLLARNTVKDIYDYVIGKGILIIFISDMYLCLADVKKALQKQGYSQNKNIYLSCENQLTKATGALYDRVLVDFSGKAKPHEILHIGDNYYSDILQARRKGLKAIYIKPIVDRLTKSKALKNFALDCLASDNTFLLGYFAYYLEQNEQLLNFAKSIKKYNLSVFLVLMKTIFPTQQHFDLFIDEQEYQILKKHKEFHAFIRLMLFNLTQQTVSYKNQTFTAAQVLRLREITVAFSYQYNLLFKADIKRFKYDKQCIYLATAGVFGVNPAKDKVKKATKINKRNAHTLAYAFLTRIGVKDKLKNVYFCVRKNIVRLKAKGRKIADFEKAIASIQPIIANMALPNILYFGDNVDFDKGTVSVINKLYDIMQNLANFMVVNEGYKVPTHKIKKLFKCDFTGLPKLLAKDYYITFNKYACSPHIALSVKKDERLQLAYKNFSSKYPDADEDYAKIKVYYTDQYFKQLVQSYQPKLIIMWNQFHWQNSLLDSMCKANNIGTMYMEFGVLPNTVSLEQMGQMGESIVAKHPQKLLDIVIDEQEINHAIKTIDYLYRSKINRNSPPNNTYALNVLKKKLDKTKTTVLFAGHHDYDSGVFPYTINANLSHSPVFQTSNEAAEYLAKMAQANDWNFIYKPHPSIFDACKHAFSIENKNTFVVNDIDINELIDLCTVAVTVLSQVSYIVLIRNKPLLMLGYNQLKDKACNYQAFNKKNIKKQIKLAIRQGYTTVQKGNFVRHVAQLNKAYLYSNVNDKPFKYGRDIASCKNEIVEMIEKQ